MTRGGQGNAEERSPAQFEEGRGYLLYKPAGYRNAGRGVPLIFVLSPVGEANDAITPWRGIADSRTWLVAGSKDFQNGIPNDQWLPKVREAVYEIMRKESVDTDRIALAGFSGGGQGAYVFTAINPNLVSAVVSNSGIIHCDGARRFPYRMPNGKKVVIMASPHDSNYPELKNDREFLKDMSWDVEWLEFETGHAVAPYWIYDQTAIWLESEW